MNETKNKLTVKQAKVLQILVQGGRISEAANEAGASRASIYKWIELPHFQNELKRAERESVDVLSRSLTSLGLLARKALKEALESPDTPQAVKIRAADIVLSRMLQLMELCQFEARLNALESEVLR